MTLLYRIIHIDNLPGLLARGCDCAPNVAKAEGIAKRSIFHPNIMDKREHAVVRVAPGGYVADYVPFYFGPRSPMLYAIKEGKVAGYQGQREIIYLVVSAEDVEAAQIPFAFTDGHAIMNYIRHDNRLADLSKVRWDIIGATYWNNFEDGRCRRQAEFLVRDRFPLSLVREIGVMDEAVGRQVATLLEPTSLQPLLQVRREWYF